MGKYYETENVDKVVQETFKTGILIHNMARVKAEDYCSYKNIFDYEQLPLVTKYRLYMAYLKDAEESPLSYLDIEQYYVFWDLRRF